jgi:Uma2 family endonuclease
MTAAEFLAWHPSDGKRWELIDGTPHAMAPASPRHAAILGEASRLIGNHLAERMETCRVLVEPGVQPRVRAARNVRVPDLAVTCAEWDRNAKALAAPLLLIEILSPSNEADTWANVWSYTTVPTVTEILVLYSEETRGDLLRRQEDGTWPTDPQVLTLGDDVRLESIRLSIALAAFYRTA